MVSVFGNLFITMVGMSILFFGLKDHFNAEAGTPLCRFVKQSPSTLNLIYDCPNKRVVCTHDGSNCTEYVKLGVQSG